MTTSQVSARTEPAGPQAPRPAKDPRLAALRRFAVSISVLNILGYAFFGFEQPWLWPVMCVAAGYATDLLMETVNAWAGRRSPAYRGGGFTGLVSFLLPAHITALAVNMLLYANDQPWPVVFAVVVAVSQKALLRAPINGKLRHFMNPSNFGIVVALLAFHWVSIAPPYEFTENAGHVVRWIIPAAILVSGTMLNAQLTRKLPLISGLLLAFTAQALVRHLLFGTAWISALVVMTGTAFVLFANYMVTDPGTTPAGRRQQFAFGASVSIAYGVLMALHIVYGLFFALAIVCVARGAYHWCAVAARALRATAPATAEPAPAQAQA